MQYDMYSDFDLGQHKASEYRYDTEVVILPNGKIEYAMPSHTEKLISLTGLHRDVIYDLMPVTASPIHWLVDFTGCISVWNHGHLGMPKSKEQQTSLKLLIREGLTK